MSIVTREPIISDVENTIMRKVFVDGVHTQYEIEAFYGYVLHDNRLDYPELDPKTMEETTKLGYTGQAVTCRYDYDFIKNPFEFYAVPENLYE